MTLRADTAVSPGRRAWVMLAGASVGYVLCVWAWALLGPLAPILRERLGLTPLQQALVVAVPVVVGSVGRIPAGALTDRFGGRRAFLVVALVAIAAAVQLGLVGHRSLGGLLLGGALLGAAGSAFAVGVPFVSGWFPETRRGLAIGVLGMGVCGSAISGVTSVRLAARYGLTTPFLLAAVALAGVVLIALLILRDPPARALADQPIMRRLGAALRMPITRQASGWYSIAFGGFVAFSVYLPAYLHNAYGLAPAAAVDRMAAFVLVAVLMRPVGGWLADRLSPLPVLAMALVAVVAAAVALARTPPLAVAMVALLVLSAGLAAASAAAIVQIGRATLPAMVGAVTGVVTAIAGLAGFAAPLIMALAYSRTGSYGPALALLATVSVAALLGVLLRFRANRRAAVLTPAPSPLVRAHAGHGADHLSEADEDQNGGPDEDEGVEPDLRPDEQGDPAQDQEQPRGDGPAATPVRPAADA
jgi:NNP family nitrate/nitrite transporter-like MFS transporter